MSHSHDCFFTNVETHSGPLEELHQKLREQQELVHDFQIKLQHSQLGK